MPGDPRGQMFEGSSRYSVPVTDSNNLLGPLGLDVSLYSPTGLLPIILQQITLLTYERPKLYPSILAIPQPISNRLWGNEILNMADADQLTYILSGDSFESLSFNPLD